MYLDHDKNGWYISPCLNKYQKYQVNVTSSKDTQESNRIDFFPTKSRLPNTTLIDQLSAALEDLKHECNPTIIHHPVVESKDGTTLNQAIKQMRQLFHFAITTVSNIINDLSSPSNRTI